MQIRKVTQRKEKREREIQAIRFGLTRNAVAQPKTTILILEENPALRDLLRWILITGGYRHCTATQEMSTDQSFAQSHIILLDSDGSRTWKDTVVSPLWEQKKTPPFIMLTCHPQRTDEMKQSGFQVLQKPFHVHDLLQAVAIALEQHTRADCLDSSSQLERFRRLSHFD